MVWSGMQKVGAVVLTDHTRGAGGCWVLLYERRGAPPDEPTRQVPGARSFDTGTSARRLWGGESRDNVDSQRATVGKKAGDGRPRVTHLFTVFPKQASVSRLRRVAKMAVAHSGRLMALHRTPRRPLTLRPRRS